MHIHSATPVAGARRPRIVGHLVVASIMMTLAIQGSAHASADAAPAGRCAAVSTLLTKASDGLLMPSESDAPFTPFHWTGAATRRLTIPRMLRLTGHAPDTPVEVVDLDWFFRNVAQHQPWHDPQQAADVRRFQRLERVLEQRLADVRVYRIGTIRIDAYIVGRCGDDLAGASTVLIET